MIGKSHRLQKTQDIQRVLRHGRRQRTAYFTIYTSPSTGTVSRFTCIVGKKVSAKAVVRNRMKRWLREIGKSTIVKHSSAMDAVIVAHPSIVTVKTLAGLKASAV